MSSQCAKCHKAVYPQDPQVSLDGTRFHKSCAKCADCSTQITLSNFTKSSDNTLLCKVHYFKRFREEGNYAGGEQFQRKGTVDLRKELRSPATSEAGSSVSSYADAIASPTSPNFATPSTGGSCSSNSSCNSGAGGGPASGSTVVTTVVTSTTGGRVAAAPVDSKLGRSASGSEDAESTRPVSERLPVVERPVLAPDDLKARRATFGGGVRAQQLKATSAGSSSSNNKCMVCSKSVFPNDPQISLDSTKFHKACAKCADCGTQITLSNFTKAPDHTLLCKTHYFKRFREEGNYVGGEQFKQKGTAEARADLRKLGSVGSGLMADGAGDQMISSPTVIASPAADQPPPPSPSVSSSHTSTVSPPAPPPAVTDQASVAIKA